MEVTVRVARDRFVLDASFTSGPGVTVLAGPSGAGKSTVVAAIAGLARPDAGRIVVDGTVLFDSREGVDLATARRRVGYVLQDALLFPHLSVAANLRYSRRPVSLPFERVVDILGIGHLLDSRPNTLSGGERQRVAIGRALLSGPALLLMDEPLASLDTGRRRELLPFIENVRAALSIPVVYVTHNWPEIIRLADTVALMEQGRVRACGPVQHVLAGRNEEIAHLVPEGSVLDAVTTGERIDGLDRLDTPAGPFFLNYDAGPAGRALRVFIDAHDVTLALHRPDGLSVQNTLQGTVADMAERDGSNLDVRIALPGNQTIRSRITRHAGEALGLRPGMDVFALIKSVAFDRRLHWHGTL
ncbi:MAG: molybdenum ABC transporter ATP-binding protein [Alphaproteobacteria bacterium]|nr:molybdenum ABC transporter ATP-binding protein [Alphaproteobacteria bacterium]